MADPITVRRALLSVSDKSGIVEFARGLHGAGVELISTGGTAKALADAGIPVIPIEQVTGFPEMMDGRVKTLHPKIHGGLLALRNDHKHQRSMAEHQIAPIDLVCINLYPFSQTVARPDVTLHEAIENIDIGGPSMVRSAAKNHAFVLVVTDPAQYGETLAAIGSGGPDLAMRRRYAARAFAQTARYDTAIAAWMTPRFDAAAEAPRAETDELPARLTVDLTRAQSLRYGENPHQKAALYVRSGRDVGLGVPQAEQLHGKELSYNNLNDAAAAVALAGSLAMAAREARASADAPATAFGAAVIKHANPCGAAAAPSVEAAIEEAVAGDPLAAFGGIVAVTGMVDEAAAAKLCGKDVFFEVLAAPSYTPGALEQLRTRWSNLRILKLASASFVPPEGELEMRSIPGGFLVQERDAKLAEESAFAHKAGPLPTLAQLRVARMLEPVCRALTSNAVCIGGVSPARGETSVRLFGAGAGQMDRLASCRLAVSKAGALARNAVAFSDAFFPFADGPRVLIDAGVSCIVHPGGSKRDQETFDLCNERKVTCLVMGLRHFRH